MDKICIICREAKEQSKFNLEHVFPATIGGSFIIGLVCTSCNSLLSKNFDQPFLQNPWIGLHRKTHNLHRSDDSRDSKRSIRNPLKKIKLEGFDNKNFYIDFDEHGSAIQLIKPQIKEENTSDGILVSVTCSKQDLNRVLKDLSKKYQFDINKAINIVEETQEEPLNYFIRIENEPILFEGLKIAYEFALTMLPHYFNDKLAILISDFLYTKENIEEINNHIYSANEILPSLQAQLELMKEIPFEFHSAVLKNIKGVGLICFIKMFDKLIPYRLSHDKYFSTLEKEICLFINFIEKTHGLILNLEEWKSIDLQLDLKHLNPTISSDIFNNHQIYFAKDRPVPIFNSVGEKIIDNLNEIIPQLFHENQKIDFLTGQTSYDISLPEKEWHIKYKSYEILIPLIAFKANYNLVL